MKLMTLLLVCGLLFSGRAADPPVRTTVRMVATCVGADPCNACKNCKYCKRCAKQGEELRGM